MKSVLFKETGWERAAAVRRVAVFLLIVLSTLVASSHMADLLPHRGSTALELAIVSIFAALFGWISIGFWEALTGLFTLVRRYDRFVITRSGEKRNIPDVTAGGRTAILVPIANEEVARVFAGIRTIYRSIEETGQLSEFDFFVLSDSNNPDTWVEEEVAWADLCADVRGFGRIFYRHRKVNLKRKSGNIADFCRRWGKSYRYMVVLDADSVMSGATLVHMVRLMEQNPKVGIIQSSPVAVGRETLIGRIQQFANHVYGPLFVAGLSFLQLGDSHFWGHNAIIRVAPFMEHCSLPQLPGKPPRGGAILSHDFVEAAFIRRGGWEVWLAYELRGTYEEVPPTLMEELKRDRRWCQGNMQHVRLLFARGLLTAHRALFLHGAMSYISSLLWFAFLSLSTVEAVAEVFREPVYFPTGRALFPDWPVWHPRWALTLLTTTAVILFLPKLLSTVMAIAWARRSREFGGVWRLSLSMVVEVVFSALFAPIRMFFHSKFVFYTLLGAEVGWGPQQRSDSGTPWAEALRFHAGGMLLGFLWGAFLFTFNRSFFWWNTPVFLPLVFSVPLSVWSSRAAVGRVFQRMGLFLIPEEIAPPPDLERLEGYMEQARRRGSLRITKQQGFIRAAVIPGVNRLHCFLLRSARKVSPAIATRRRGLLEKALVHGPWSMDPREKKELLRDPDTMRQLHQRVWETSDPALSEAWGISPQHTPLLSKIQ